MRISRLIIILNCFFTFIYTGCELYSRRTVKINLPSDPFISEWLIEYPEKVKEGQVIFASENVTVESTGGDTVIQIRIARGVNLPVLALPVFPGFTGGFPAGAVYPADVLNGNMNLDWAAGFSCEILKTCLLNSDAVASFNTLRFRESLMKKTEELLDSEGQLLPGGYWLIDPVSIISRLGYGLFRASSIKSAKTMNLSIPVSGGTFVSDNPFYPAIDAVETEDGIFLNVLLPVNRRTIFFNPESGEIVGAFFDGSRWCWMNLLTEASESGRL